MKDRVTVLHVIVTLFLCEYSFRRLLSGPVVSCGGYGGFTGMRDEYIWAHRFFVNFHF